MSSIDSPESLSISIRVTGADVAAYYWGGEMNVRTATLGVAVTAVFALNAANAQGFDEAALVAQIEAKRAANQVPGSSEHWFQPGNRKTACKVVSVSPSAPMPTSVKWFGDCRDGKAHGIGIAVLRYGSPEVVQIAVEEYDPASDAPPVTYRQVVRHPAGTIISTGRLASVEDTVSLDTSVGKSPAGNASITTSRRYCKALECAMRIIDPMTGTTSYTITGPNNYRVLWLEQRANNQPLYSMRAVELDGVSRAQKWIVDGVPYDLATDMLSGATARYVFATGLNSVLVMPFERYAAVSSEIDAAVRLSDSKFAAVQSRYCATSNDPDVRLICHPSSLIPEETVFAAAKAEVEQAGHTTLQQLRRNAASAQVATAHRVQAQEDIRRQQEENRLIQEREQREALRRGFEALSQAGQAAQQYGQQIINQGGGYQAPQVQTPTLNRPPVAHCRTIGYITTCN